MTDFVDGLIAKKPHDNAPDFVKANVSMERQEQLTGSMVVQMTGSTSRSKRARAVSGTPKLMTGSPLKVKGCLLFT